MSDKIKILIVEDETPIREFISLNLKLSNFDTLEASTGEEAVELYPKYKPHVILLDIMLPGIDGFETCKIIRHAAPDAAIIMLTARGQDSDKIMGLEIGADDYIIKPFNPLELIARIRALLRRMQVSTSDTNKIHSGPFEVNMDTQNILKNGSPLELTPREFSLLKTLIENPNKALSRDELLDLAWGKEFFGDPKTLDVHVRRLREKIEDSPSAPRYLSTVWGFGYMWKEN